MARVCVDSTYFSVNGSGLLTFNPASVGIQQLLVYDTVGVTNFTKASFPGLRKLRIRAIGGGGGAGGAQAVPATTSSVAREGASGGGYSESLINASAIGASESITVGAGGAGGVGNNNGGAGGSSSFGGFVIALGGNGGGLGMPLGASEWTAPGTPPGGLGTGQIRATGESGGQAKRSADLTCQALAGGSSGGGLGAGGTGRVAASNGENGYGYGGGGSGAISFGAVQTGGAGSRGAVLIELFY